MTLDECDAIFEAAFASRSEEDFLAAIEPLFENYQILSLGIGRGSIYWRARVIREQPYKKLAELDYPPAPHAALGRLNDKGVPCFYVATRKETALAEVHAREGDRVQIAGFRITHESDMRLAVIGECANIQKNGYLHFLGQDPEGGLNKWLNSLPRETALVQLYIDRFFAHVLTDPQAAKVDYLHSRALGKAIHAKNEAVGIVFPSVQDRGGFNIAISAAPSDQLLHNVCCVVVEKKKNRHFGFVDFEILQAAERLDEDNNFVWMQNRSPEHIGLYNMTAEEHGIAMKNTADRNALLNVLSHRRKAGQ